MAKFDYSCKHIETDDCHCIECQECGAKFQRDGLEYLQLKFKLTTHSPNDPSPKYVCFTCSLELQVKWYKERLIATENNVEALKNESNLFRTIMLDPKTMEALSNEPMLPPVRFYINQHRPGWESMSLETILHWMEVFEAHAKTFAEIANTKASKEEIKNTIKERSEKTHQQVKETQKKLNATPKERKVLSAFDKAVKAFTDLGFSEIDAKNMVNQATKQ